MNGPASEDRGVVSARCQARFPSLTLTLKYLPAAAAARLGAGYALLDELCALADLEHQEVFILKCRWWRDEIERLATGSPEHPLAKACLASHRAVRQPLAAGFSALLAALDVPPPRANSVDEWWQTPEPLRSAQTTCEILLACGFDAAAGSETIDPETFIAEHAPWAERFIAAAEVARLAWLPAPPRHVIPPLELQARHRFRSDEWSAADFSPALRGRVLREWLAPPAAFRHRLAAALANEVNRSYAHFLWTVSLADRRRQRLCRRARPADGTVTPGDALALWRAARRLPPA